jgi:hypothetical protein
MRSAVPLALAAILLWSTAGIAQASDEVPQGGSSTVSESAPSAGAMAFDLVVVRPLGLAATVIGAGVFILNLPLTPFEKDAPQAPFQRLIVDPAHYTFTRPLGAM